MAIRRRLAARRRDQPAGPAGVVAGGPEGRSQDAYGPALGLRQDPLASFLVRASSTPVTPPSSPTAHEALADERAERARELVDRTGLGGSAREPGGTAA